MDNNKQKINNIDEINSIIIKQKDMFYSIYDFISDKYKNIISEKIKQEEGALNKTITDEKKEEESFEIDKTELDPTYFNKRSLNINNL
jgi:hypothetical protein